MVVIRREAPTRRSSVFCDWAAFWGQRWVSLLAPAIPQWIYLFLFFKLFLFLIPFGCYLDIQRFCCYRSLRGSVTESIQEKLGRVTMKWPLHTVKGQILPHPHPHSEAEVIIPGYLGVWLYLEIVSLKMQLKWVHIILARAYNPIWLVIKRGT